MIYRNLRHSKFTIFCKFTKFFYNSFHTRTFWVLIVSLNSIYIKTISILGKTMGHRLIGSTPLIGNYNDNPHLALIVSFNSIYIKTISTFWKKLGHRLTESTVVIRKNNNTIPFL